MNDEEHQEDEDYGYDIDDAYDRIRDDDSIFLLENVEEVISKLKNTMYYRNNMERIAKDMIQHILHEANLKIKDVRNITDTWQVLEFENVKENEKQ